MELYNKLENQLKKEANFVSDEGKLKKWVIADHARNYSKDLLTLLLADDSLKLSFFEDVNGVTLFMLEKFLSFIEQKNFLNDSYTSYKNKIGLRINGRFINQINDVEMVWPYKDCVLEGGQSKDDVKRREIFFNQTLAQDEISQLLDPKVLTNYKRFGVFSSDTIFNRDEDFNKKRNLPKDTITDNLIIKGNNLLALHSLKREFAGKIKLIAIDPPYYFSKPKPSDTFSYNSNFRLSTWLVFMKNRLEVAKDLLATNGVILCHIKEDAVHYLKILMEEVFHADNFVETFIWKNTDNPDSLSNKSRSSVEYVLCFEKKRDSSLAYKGKETENGDGPILHTGNKIKELIFPKGSIHFNIPDGTYTGKPDRVELITPVVVENGLNKEEVRLSGEFAWDQDNLNEEYERGTYFLVKSNKFSVRAQKPEGTTMAPEKYIDEQYLSKAIGVGTNEDATTHLKNMGINFTNSKPESVVSFFIRAITNEYDIVCDFFLGSGTTAAVAHKMNRQYIGIDQMDYIETETLKRMQQVIDGEQGGVSVQTGWNPQNPSLEDSTSNRYARNNFVYFELKRYNEAFIDQIKNASSTDTLLEIWSEIKEKAFFAYNVDMKTFDEQIETFKELSLDEQKMALCEILDKNQLYVNLSDLNNADYSCSEEEIKVSTEFYQISK